MRNSLHAPAALAALALIMGQANAQNPNTPSTPQDTTQSSTTLENVPSTAPPAPSDSYRNSLQSLPNEPTAAGSSNYSWIPYTTSGYVGLSVGQGKLDTECVAGQLCEDPDTAFHVYTGGMFSPNFGLQLGYLQFSDAERNGGTTEVKGLNLTLVGTIPLGSSFNINGRLGGTYGWTKTTVGPGVLTAFGDVDGFGPAYGIGVSWNFSPNWALTVDWDRHRLKYVGDVSRNTDVAAIGVKYSF